ncbi:cobalamin biosynthesis protein [uncultured Corynebacterium sp.]|uniref:cobalamin biosynthesis protein n=1 Tax=uncultured Corynebacterium sp. TaxID=159447 RepID=UPI0025D3E6DE|nr:cobalamin biosynthesis protein [uncultured Corynebacterium sp.]
MSHTLHFYPAGGVVTPEQWLALGQAAREHADGYVYLDEHSVVTLRGVDDEADMSSVSLPHSAPHVVASPLSLHARTLAARVAEELAAAMAEHEVALTRLVHTVVGIDGGHGDIVAHGVSLGLQLHDPTDTTEVRLIRKGQVFGEALALDDALPTLIDSILTAVTSAPIAGESTFSAKAEGADSNRGSTASAQAPIGWLTEHTAEGRVDLGAGLHKGVLPGEYAGLIAQLDVPITVTPWRGLVLHDLADGDADVVLRVLAPRGFIFDAQSPYLQD